MQAELIQTKSGFEASYQVLQGGNCLYSAEVAFPLTEISVKLFKEGQHICTLHSDMYADPVVARGADGVEQRKALQVLDDRDNCLGQIFYHWVPRTTPYFQIEYRGGVWAAYEVGMGKQGLKLPVYQGETQVGLLEKCVRVKDNLDTYSLCAVDGGGLFLTVLFGLYYDFKRYRNAGEFAKGKASSTLTFSFDKNLKAKYDPTFRDLCR